MTLLSTNPILCKIKYINRDSLDTATGIGGVLGKAFHVAMSVYYGGTDELIISNESEAIEYGMKAGMQYLNDYNDGFIEFSTTIPNKQKALEILTFAYQEYIKQFPYKPDQVVATEQKIEQFIDIEWRGKQLNLPIKLKGYIDKIERVDGKLKIRDYKLVHAFSNPDKIDGAKILQAVEYYLLAYAEYGEEPYSCIFDEVKRSKNKDSNEPQVRSYEIVFADNDLYFDFYFRFYEDVIKALNGEMVFLPNVHAIFDNEVAIIAYIHRLDISEETAKLMKKHKVYNVTELLKKEIQSAGNMRKLLKTVEDKFVSAKNIDYEKMSMEEKIQTKMLEHGKMLTFDSKIEGVTVDLYRFRPSIGVKMSNLLTYASDIEQVVGISDIRILAPIPNTKLVGFEIPREQRIFPVNTQDSENLLAGIDIGGNVLELVIEDLPHLLVAGTTGSGKSVFLNQAIQQLEKKYDLTLIDPKGVEFPNGISDSVAIARMLENFVDLMTKRYAILRKKGFKKWSQTGQKSDIIIIDEYNDLVMSSELIEVGKKEIVKVFAKKTKVIEQPIYEKTGVIIDKNIKLLAQKSRAAGIHIILATQRPSVKVLDGDIKANFPTRVCFRLPTSTDSKVVLDTEGAEKLKGKGDGLLLKDGYLTRFQSFNL